MKSTLLLHIPLKDDLMWAFNYYFVMLKKFTKLTLGSTYKHSEGIRRSCTTQPSIMLKIFRVVFGKNK